MTALLLALSLAAQAEAGSTRIFDRHGVLLQELSPEGESRREARLEEVSPWVLLATLAAEDRRFFEHGALDPLAIARALWQNLRTGRVVSGASTLTQQLARAERPRPRGWTAKAREALSAVALESRLEKREILERYLNLVSYGNRAVGIEAASRLYLGKPAASLSLAEAAYLCAIPRSPGTVNPYRNEAKLRRRQREILERMRRWGWAEEDAAALALKEPLQVLARRNAALAPHFALAVRRTSSSGDIRTTLDPTLQAAAADALRAHLAGLRGHRVGNGALLLLDNRTREVLAWVGSADFADEERGGQNDGVLALRQPGSALKPFVYGLALSKGWTPSTLVPDLPAQTPDRFSPRNYDGKFHGLVRLREALACSYNAAAIALADKLGAHAILSALRQAGFRSLDKPAEHYGLALALGDGEVSLAELANAYATLGSGGVWKPLRLVAGAGPEEPPRRLFSPQTAYLLSRILSDNTARAPAFGFFSPFNAPFPLAAKTGTTKDYRDNWAVGFTPEWTAAVWVGNFDGKPMAKVSGISGAGPILRDAAFALWKARGASEFPRPRGVRELEVCPVSGERRGPRCPTAIAELFDEASLPKGPCRTHAPAPGPEGKRLLVEFPRQDDIFKLDPTFSRKAQQLKLKASGFGGSEEVRWSVDGRELEAAPDGTAWWPLAPGRHRIRVRAGPRRSPEVRIFVAGDPRS
ncbi:MAG TPA: penicillin-binding protein 1C [Elusimicrobia bacterium]|nr:penicillin-binding protein 1C [Elusimicrobiota bacterium]